LFEIIIIKEDENKQTVKTSYKRCLITFNVIELLLELGLYGCLLQVFSTFRKFLDSVIQQKISKS